MEYLTAPLFNEPPTNSDGEETVFETGDLLSNVQAVKALLQDVLSEQRAIRLGIEHMIGREIETLEGE